jgi:hypothetical protein
MALTRKNLDTCSASSGELSDDPNLLIDLCSSVPMLIRKSKGHLPFRMSNIADGIQQGMPSPRNPEVEVAL